MNKEWFLKEKAPTLLLSGLLRHLVGAKYILHGHASVFFYCSKRFTGPSPLIERHNPPFCRMSGTLAAQSCG